MKLITYSVFRALCAIAVGALLVKYREEMVEWMTIAIGALFLLSGLAAIIMSVSKKEAIAPVASGEENSSTTVAPYDDASAIQGGTSTTTYKRAGWGWGSFVGLGSMILGLILVLMPKTFVEFLVYIISAFLIIGAIQQFVTLGGARKHGTVGFAFWIMPLLLLIVGCIALFKPTVFASAPLYFIGWFLICYGVVECINALKARSNRKKYEKEQNFYNLNQKPDFSNAEEVEAEEVSL